MPYTPKPFFKKYTDDERFALLRTNTDIICRFASELASLRESLQEQLNNGKEQSNTPGVKELILLFEEKASIIKKKTWANLCMFCELHNIDMQSVYEELKNRQQKNKPNKKGGDKK